jgi:uncharacterized protein with HEPN domain
MNPKADRIYLAHILECVALIQDYTRNGAVRELMKNGRA